MHQITQEFGIYHYNSNSTAAAEQLLYMDDFVRFQARNALAACWHNESRKVTLLFQYHQIDLESASVEQNFKIISALKNAPEVAQKSVFCAYQYCKQRLRKLSSTVRHPSTTP